MRFQTREVEGLRRIFQSAFGVLDVAESLASFDQTASLEEIGKCMDENHLEVVGIRTAGKVTGYVESSGLAKDSTLEATQSIADHMVIADTASLVDVVCHLKNSPFLFVSILGQIGGLVHRNDLEKPASRMWLFGMVTLIEMRTCTLIEKFCPNDSWQQFVSSGRLEKAKVIQAERERRNRKVALLDCLQLSDKLQVVARNTMLRQRTRFESRKQMEHSMKAIEKLRNNLAHSQDIVANDWDVIVNLAENFEKVLSGPPGLHDRIDEEELD